MNRDPSSPQTARDVYPPSSEKELDWGLLREKVSQIARRRLGSKLRSKLDESDIVQQSLLDVHRQVCDFELKTPKQKKQWLRRLVENNLVDAFRFYCKASRRDISKEVPLESQSACRDSRATSPSRIFMNRERDASLLKALETIPESSRLLLTYRHQWGWTFAKIGQKLGMTEEQARYRWSKVIDQLRSELASSE